MFLCMHVFLGFVYSFMSDIYVYILSPYFFSHMLICLIIFNFVNLFMPSMFALIYV